MVRTGLIGAGLMGRQHARSIAAHPGMELVAVTAHDNAQAEALAAEFGGTVEPSAESLLAREDIDCVTIATPTDTHAGIAIAACEQGKHIFVEKPIARTLEDAQAIVSAAEKHDRVLGVGHVIRYFPDYRKIGELIEDGAIGIPAVATFGRRCQQPDWAPDAWHTQGDRGGGVTIDMMIHDVDLVRWYFGEPTTVFGMTIGPDAHNGLDYSLATLTVPGGPICHLHGSWSEPDGFSQSAEVCGSLGMIEYDSRWPEMTQLSRHSAVDSAVTALPPPPPGTPDPFQLQYDDFLAAIAGERDMPADGAWALRSLEIVTAIVASSDSGQPVEMIGAGA